MRDIKPFEPLWDEWTSIKLLGQGSFGKVYKMVKRERGKEYYTAVKHLSLPSKPDEADELYAQGKVNSVDHATMKKYYDDALEKLLSEIDLLEKVKANTNIVSYEGFRKIDKPSGIGYDIFIKMELLTGLPNHIAGGGLTVQDVVKLGEDICRALMVLRVEEIVHRDIKPANILVNSRGDYKLGDFGVSKVLGDAVNGMTIAGSFDYMAPEIINRHCGDYRVDIYSLGLVLYRLLNKNRLPIAVDQRLTGEPLLPPVDADEELSSIILKACAFRPKDRWQTPEEMGQALEKYRLSMKQAVGTIPDSSNEPAPPTVVSSSPPPEEPVQRDSSPPTEVLPINLPSGEEPTQVLETAPQTGESVEEKAGPMDEPTGQKPQTPHEPVDKNVQPVDKPAAKKAPLTDKFTQLLHKPTNRKAPQSSPTDKVKTVVVAGVAVAFVLIGGIAASFVANQASRPDETSTQPEPTAASSPLPPSQAVTPEPIEWQDPFIHYGVLKALSADGESLTPELLSGLEALCLSVPEPDPNAETEPDPPAPISTLADLSMLTGLKTLELSGHPVEEFNFPEDMPSLETLKLAGCGCTSLEFLEQPCFQNLRELDLSGNGITDLAPLAGLSELTSLNISQTPVTSLEPLAGLSGLKVLFATDVQVGDWGPVAHVEQVEGRPEASPPPEETPEPDETPQPSAKPTSTPKPTNSPRPANTPKPTSTPTPKPTSTPIPTSPPSTPAPTPAPPPTVTPTTIAVISVSVSPSEKVLDMGGSIRLSVNISPSNATNQQVTWSSPNPSVATVTNSGVVNAVGSDTAQIAATCDGKSGCCIIHRNIL